MLKIKRFFSNDQRLIRQLLNIILMTFFFTLLLLSGLLSSVAAQSEPGEEWEWRNPLPQGNWLVDVTWSGDKFVTVGHWGTILTSPDGVIWMERTSGSTRDLRGVTWGDDKFVVVGYDTILTSPDGVIWTERAFSGWHESFNAVIWGDGMFVTVGHRGTILTSPDGVNWTEQSSGTNNSLRAVTWSGSQFVAVGWDGTLLTSPDGVNWTEQNSGTNNSLSAVTWSGDQFVIVGRNGTILTSPDGVSWTDRTLDTTRSLYGVTWGDGKFVVVCDYGPILTSPDGFDWTERTTVPERKAERELNGVTWNGSQFVAVGVGGMILTSPDGVSWTVRTSGTDHVLFGVTWSGSRYVAVGTSHYYSDDRIITSPDGEIWTEHNSGISGALTAVIWGDGMFVTVGHWGTILTSPDGVNWTEQNSGTNNSLKAVTWSDSQFVAVGVDGMILTSPDGVSWTTRSSGTTNSLYAVTWSGSRYVAVGYWGTILSSPDGVSWAARATDTSSDLRGVAWCDDQFVTVGALGMILTSPDGVSWTVQNSGTQNSLKCVTWSGDKFVAVGDWGNILTSPDGENWKVQDSSTRNRLRGVTWSGNQFVTVGDNGTILVSPPGETEPSPPLDDAFLTLPYTDSGIIIQQGWRYTAPIGPKPGDPYAHKGIDYIKGVLNQPSTWQPFDIVAAAGGVAMHSSGGGYGDFVLIRHDEKDDQGRHYFTLYGHLGSIEGGIAHRADRFATDYNNWTPVTRGQKIGVAGSSGVTDPSWKHLHFEVQRGGYAQSKVDPYDINSIRNYYPGGESYSSSGENSLWTADPPEHDLKLPQLEVIHPLSIISDANYPYLYHEGDKLTAVFTIVNREPEPVTLDSLVVRGLNMHGDEISFPMREIVVLDPNESYVYSEELVMQESGIYEFYTAYYTNEHGWVTDMPLDPEESTSGSSLLSLSQTYNHAMVTQDGDENTNTLMWVSVPRFSVNVFSSDLKMFSASSIPSSAWQKVQGPWDQCTVESELKKIIISPDDPDVVYALETWYRENPFHPYQRVDRGSKIYRLNSTGEWDQIGDGLWTNRFGTHSSIDVIAVAPSDSNVLYLSIHNLGIYRSIDGGQNWQRLFGPTVPTYFGLSSTSPFIESIAIHPENPDIVYVGTRNNGIFKTENGGNTWVRWADPLEKVKLTANYYIDQLVINPANPKEVYASGYFRERGGNLLYPSSLYHVTEDDQAMIKINCVINYPIVTTLPFPVSQLITDINIRPDGRLYFATNRNHVYAFNPSDNKLGGPLGSKGSNPLPFGGSTWLASSTSPFTLIVHPVHPNIVYGASLSAGVYVSTNFGRDWTYIGLKDKGVREITADKNMQRIFANTIDGLYKIDHHNTILNLSIKSPGELRINDSEGRLTGKVDGEVFEEIPGSLYNEGHIVIYSPTDSYNKRVIGTDEGGYGIDIFKANNAEHIGLSFREQQTYSGTIHQYNVDWALLETGDKGVTVEIDEDGDGYFEESYLLAPPYKPCSPDPANKEEHVANDDVYLSWTGGSQVSEEQIIYDIYIGQDENFHMVDSIGPFPADQTELNYNAGYLEINSYYYWKIVARGSHGINAESPVWQFDTYEYIPHILTVTKSGNGKGEISESTSGLECNEVSCSMPLTRKTKITLNAIADKGSHFVGWFENGTLLSDEASFSYESIEDRNLIANFALDSYVIKIFDADNGSISPSGEVVTEQGSEVTFTITPNEGFELSDVFIDGESVGAVNNYAFENVTGDHTISACFLLVAPNLSSLSVSVDGNDLTLEPAFEPGITDYSVNVAHDVESIDITANLSDENATMTIAGIATGSGVDRTVTLEEPGTSTPIDIVVTAEDNTTQQTYSIQVNRGFPSPAIPTLSAPGHGEVIAGESATLEWSPSEGADFYSVYLVDITDPADHQVIAEPPGSIISGTTYTVEGLSDEGRIYAWTVAASDSATGLWSSYAGFRVFVNGTDREVLPPTLTSPEAEAYIEGTSVTLEWEGPAGADFFTIWLFNLDTGETVAGYDGSEVYVGTSHTVEGLTDNGETYAWSVAASDGATWSDYAFPRLFVNE